MQFKVNSTELEKALTKVFPAVPTKTPVETLSSFLIEIKDGVLTILATDLEMAAKSQINVVADSDFKALIQARKLYDTVRSLNNVTLIFEVMDNNRLKLLWDKGEFIIGYYPEADFPELPTFFTENDPNVLHSINMDGNTLSDVIYRTSFAISDEDFRPALKGLLFEFSEEGLRFVSTDGHKLVNLLLPEYAVENAQKYIVPGDTLNVLSKNLGEHEVKIAFRQNSIAFVMDNFSLTSRLIEGNFPDYKSVIPLENEYTLVLEPKTLLTSLRRILLISRDTLKRVKISLKEGEEITLFSQDYDIGDESFESIPAEYQGEEMEIGFNGDYLIQVVQHLSDKEKILFKIHSPSKAVLILPAEKEDNSELIMLLMPVRLNV